MKLLDFRITNFRSIDDTGWCAFSADSVTVLIGQNESGKSSILSALEKSFDSKTIDDDDVRSGSELPCVFVRIETSFEELEAMLDDDVATEEQLAALRKYIRKCNGKLEYRTTWKRNASSTEHRFTTIRDVPDPILIDMLEESWVEKKNQPSLIATSANADSYEEEQEEEEEEDGDDDGNQPTKLTPEIIGKYIFYAGPLTVLFDEKTGLLPNTVDIIKNERGFALSGDGATAAENYLRIANIDLEGLMIGDARARQSMLHRGNEKVTANFATFWSQTIGKKDKLYLKCELDFYDASSTKKSGSPYLTFWITDGPNHLYPKQRSTGVRWFLSFYLQLKASEAEEGEKIFLLDEPGANLHSKAQADVLNLINTLGHKQHILYSTHSASMIEYEKLYRVLAVQRESDQDGSPSVIIHAHKLGAASRDTLSVILAAIGADFSQQEVIRKQHNVILEEMSGFYYLKSFWKLCGATKEAHFIAATGANNVELLANMFLGWGLGFIAAVDDDPTGRGVFKNIKRNMFGDDEVAAKARLIKIEGNGIEDIFSKEDFATVVLNDPSVIPTGANSQYVKDKQLSKPVLAYQFWIKVSQGDIKFKKLDEETRKRINTLVTEISSRLN